MGAVTVLCPRTIGDALLARSHHPRAAVLAGGTDLMVGVNAGRIRPETVISIAGIDELAGWSATDTSVTIGAGMTYTQLLHSPVAQLSPALFQASLTVGSPQIRNAGTIGGNLATGSPAGDTLPVLAALDASIHLASVSGARTVGINDFIVGPKRTTLAEDELITGVTIPVANGPQEYLKIGVRNAMAIAMVSVALIVDRSTHRVQVALGAAGPIPIRPTEAEQWVAEQIDWESGLLDDPDAAATFGKMVADASRPIDDHRGSAEYRRHAVGVLARRALTRSFPVPNRAST